MLTPRRSRRVAFGVSVLLLAAAVVATPAIPALTPSAQAAGPGAVYVDEPLQGGSLANWSLQGAGNYSNSNGSVGGAWTPLQTTVAQNNAFPHSYNTNYCGVGSTADTWPLCTATRNADRDGAWLTLTTDNTNNGGGQAGTALHNTAFDSDLGVVLEYDQRVYRTNDGRSGGTPTNQAGGDGIGVYLVDANPPSYSNAAIDTSIGEAGGYGAGLGYSAVSSTGDNWCGAQQGVPGGYLGIGFDVYGNYQKAENAQGFGQYHRATRPNSIAGSNPAATTGVGSTVNATRIPQSIGLRGSGVRYSTAPSCNSNSNPDGMRTTYGQVAVPLVTNPGFHTVFQVKWTAGDAESLYTGEYQVGGTGAWTSVPAQTVPAAQLPAGFTDSRGYVMFQVPDSVASFNFRYTKTGNTTQGPFIGVTRDISITGSTTYNVLNTYEGGYRWLAGTNNLSTYPNPTTTGEVANNSASRFGAVIDNVATDATDYRRVRVSITPGADGSREVVVSWTPKIDVADDRCYDANGAEITGVSTTGGTDTCVAAGGTWRYGGTYAFQEQFSYNLADSAYQAELPAQFRLGFSASTGWAVNHHQIRNVRVTSVIDLEVSKAVQFTGDSTTVDEGAWVDSATGSAGENVAYDIEVWNNGLSDIPAEYPARLVEPLTDLPFDDVNAVTWTATAVDGAQICTTWVAATLECTAYATTLSGTGPFTDAAPLRWTAPARTDAPNAGVTVRFAGTVSESAEAGPYPNTAFVQTSRAGGPQENDLTNNSDDALIEIVPRWTLGKTADPVSGSIVEAGDTITYTVAVEALSDRVEGGTNYGDIADASIIDDLSEVTTYADFEAGSVLIDGAAPGAGVTVTEPTPGNGQLLTVDGLDVPGGTVVELTYTVTVKDPAAPGVSFRNYVLGTHDDYAPEQCADVDEIDYLDNCSTLHRTNTVVQILKVGESSGGTVVPFEGSEWTVYGDDAGVLDETDIVAEFGPAPKTPQVSTGLFQAVIGPGTYWLREEKALEGFNLLPAAVAFTVAADGTVTLTDATAHIAACAPATATGLCQYIPTSPTDYSVNPTIVVQDIPILDLPESGGTTPPTLYFAAGGALLALAIAAAVVIIVRQRRIVGTD